MTSKIISSAGIQLETRVCEGGCGVTFKVMASSPQRRARSECETFCPRKESVIAHKGYGRRASPISEKEGQVFDAVLNRFEAALLIGVSKSMVAAHVESDLSIPQWQNLKSRIDRLDPARIHRYRVLLEEQKKMGLFTRKRAVSANAG